MTSRLFSTCVLCCIAGTLGLAPVNAAQDSAPKQSTSSSARSTARSGGKAVLPDPVLLDGSTQPAEKRPEFGMVGDFELPGDENVRNTRVGGPQQQQQGAGLQQQQGMMAGLPTMGGGGPQQDQQQGGAQQPPPQQQGQNSGNGPSGPQDPNAKAEGMQVAQLETDPDAGQAGPDTGPKPQPVSIGDKAMQIKSVSNAPNVVGAQQPSTAQQMEKQVGGSKASAPAGRNATERGRAMPAGL